MEARFWGRAPRCWRRRIPEKWKLAASVDELMYSIAAKAPNADSTRIAVLACLHLADRLHTLERDLASLKERVGKKSEEFAALLERAFEAEPGGRPGL